MDKGIRLKGSLESDSKCDLIVDLSTTTLDDGSVTGSRMRVYMSGSNPSCECNGHDIIQYKPTQKLVRDIPEIIFCLQGSLSLLDFEHE